MDSELELCTVPWLWIEHLFYNDAAVKSLRSACFGQRESETQTCNVWSNFILTVSLDGVDLALVVMNGCELL